MEIRFLRELTCSSCKLRISTPNFLKMLKIHLLKIKKLIVCGG